MTTVTLKRTSSASIWEGAPSKPRGANPTKLSAFAGGSQKELRSLLGFGVPRDVFNPGTQITAAVLTLRNTDTSYSSSATLTAKRITEKWTASKATWSNKPNTDATVTDVFKATSPKKGVWAFNVLPQIIEAQAAGRLYGFQIAKTGGGANGITLINSGTYVATLQITYYTGPAVPTSLSPTDGQVVSSASPTLRVASAPAGEPIFGMQVQVDPAQNGTTPAYDSGWVSADSYAPAFNLTNGQHDGPNFTPLADGTTTYWRTRVRDLDGTTTAWTPWSQFTYRSLGTLTLLEPGAAPNNKVSDPTPPIVWDLAGRTQTMYRLWFTDPDKAPGADVIWDSGIVESAAETGTPSKAVCSVVGKTYVVHVSVWDEYDRVPTGGVSEHLEVSREFTYELSSSVNPVTNLNAVDMDPYPFVKLTWMRSEAADAYQIVRDGQSVDIITAAEALVAGDQYEYIDETAAPRRPHTWVVRAIVNGAVSSLNPQDTGYIQPAGLWLSQPELDRYLPIITQASQTVGMSEDGGTFNVLGARYGVRITGALRGMSGTITGELVTTPLTGETSGSDLRDLFELMREDTGEPMILTLLDKNIRVVPFNMTVAPTPTIGHDEDYVFTASFEFIQVP